jgi:type II secretory pathway component GspD/PulD (secretin)
MKNTLTASLFAAAILGAPLSARGTAQQNPLVPPGAQNDSPAKIIIVPLDTSLKTRDGRLKSAPWIKEEARLEKLSAIKIPLKGINLDAAIRLIADAAKMNYLAPPATEFGEIVTMKVNANPFVVLETLADSYGFSMEFVNGVWRFYKLDAFEVVTRSYQIRHNDSTPVELTTNSINSTLNRGGGGMSGGGGAGGGSAGGQPSTSSGGSSIKVDEARIVKDVEKILDAETTGLEPVLQIAGTAGAFLKIAPPAYKQPGLKPKKVSGKVTYIRDAQTLLVSTTRQVHGYVEQYLAAVDQPTSHIQFGVLVVETEKNGGQDFGINWEGIAGGAAISLTNITTDANATTRGSSFFPSLAKTPYPNAVLSVSDLSIVLGAIRKDSESVVTQNPVIIARNNERTKIAANLSTPIQSASSAYMTGGGSNNQETIEYLDTGTTIEVIPQVMEPDPRVGDGKSRSCRLTVVLTIKDIIGQKTISDKEYPIIASRDYAYSVVVPDGYTLAIGGLRGSSSKQSENKIPLLGDIPIAGNLFKWTNSTLAQTNMLAFVTPHIITPEDYEKGGVERLKTKQGSLNAARAKQGLSGFVAFDKNKDELVGPHAIRDVPEKVREEELKNRPEVVGEKVEVESSPLDL